MKTIAIANEKGGAGKTSTAAALWYWMNRHGRKTLAVDLDPQGNLSLIADAATEGPTALGALLREIPAADAIQHTEQGDIIAASPVQNKADTVLTQLGRERRLKEALDTVADGYEYAIVDTSPYLGILTINALAAADTVVIPAQADLFSVHGIGQLADCIKDVRSYCNNPSLQVDGILLTRYTDRANLSKAIRGELAAKAEEMGGRLYESAIREAIAVKEAQVKHQSIFDYAPSAKVTVDYEAFCEEFLKGLEA